MRKPKGKGTQIEYAKAGASGLAGALTIIASFIYTKIAKENPPPEIIAAAQTVITTLAVYFTPHSVRRPFS